MKLDKSRCKAAAFSLGSGFYVLTRLVVGISSRAGLIWKTWVWPVELCSYTYVVYITQAEI